MQQRTWTAAARLEAVIATAALDEVASNAWCREHGVYPQELAQWRSSATQALAAPEEARAGPQQTKSSGPPVGFDAASSFENVAGALGR